MTPSRREKVEAMLSAAGLEPSAEEVDALVERSETLWPSIDRLYAMPGIRYEDHGLGFRADPPLEDWRL